MSRNFVFNSLLLLAVLLEYLFLFCFNKWGIISQEANAIGYFLSSLSFGVVLLAKFYNRQAEISLVKVPTKRFMIYGALICLCLLILNERTIQAIEGCDYNQLADIIPTIEILVKRFLAGQNPYTNDALASLYFHTPSSYLPMHWLPCVPAAFFHFDFRTMTFVVWCIGAVTVMVRSLWCQNAWIPVLTILSVSASYLYFAIYDWAIIGGTVEIMVCGYYMLLITGMNQKNALINGFFIACCLLSRYMVAIWLPLGFLVLWLSAERKFALRSAASVVFFVTVIYLIPFLSKDWTAFYRSYVNNYDVAPYGEWLHLNNKGLPCHLFDGIGFACFFYKSYLATGLFKGYLVMKKVFFVAILSTVALLGTWYWSNRRKIVNRIFLMASFKIFTSVFISFLVLPYRYFAITYIFVAIAIFAEQARYKVE